MEKEQKLMELCKKFIVDNTISCPETICQCDWVIEHAYDFIEDICEIVGYHNCQLPTTKVVGLLGDGQGKLVD